MKMLMMSLLCINNVVTDLCCTLPAKILGTVTNAEHVANETVTATKKTHSSHHQKDPISVQREKVGPKFWRHQN